MFQQTSAFIDALKQWNHEVGDYTTLDFRALLFMVSYPINAEIFVDNADEQLKALDARIRELVSNHGLKEDFLINGLIATVTKVLEHQLTGHGEAIINNEFMLKQAIEGGIQSVEDTAEKILERMKDVSYYLKAENAIDKWNVIVATNFGRAQQRKWESDRFREYYHKFNPTEE
jgi:hypothetical protein